MIAKLLTGIFLAIFYVSDARVAFYSVEYISRDVNGGWLIRYIHANGASVLFGSVYVHILRSHYYRSYQSPTVVV